MELGSLEQRGAGGVGRWREVEGGVKRCGDAALGRGCAALMLGAHAPWGAPTFLHSCSLPSFPAAPFPQRPLHPRLLRQSCPP